MTMSVLSRLGDKVAAMAVGAVAVYLGDYTGSKELALGTAGLAGAILGRNEKLGPANERVRAQIQKDVLDYYRREESGIPQHDLDVAIDSLSSCVEKAFIDPARLAKSAVTATGFSETATTEIMASLAVANEELFSPKLSHTSSYQFARHVVRASVEAAITNRAYFELLIPSIIAEMANALGRLEAGQQRLVVSGEDINRKQSEQLEILRKIEKNQSANPSDLRPLMDHLIRLGVKSSELEEALLKSLMNLEKARSELERLRSLANEVPEIEAQLAQAQMALRGSDYLDIELAQAELKAARIKYQKVELGRRNQVALNMSRMLVVEALLALTKFDFLSAAQLYGEAAGQISEFDREELASLFWCQGMALTEDGDRFGHRASLITAIDVFDKALDQIAKTEFPEMWASIQSSSGGTCFILARRGQNEELMAWLRKSIERLNRSIEICKEANAPELSGATHNNLANSLNFLGGRLQGGDSLQALHEFVIAYEYALRYFMQIGLKMRIAETQNNLATTMETISSRTTGEYSRKMRLRSFSVYDSALGNCKKDDNPSLWAIIQNNYGNALRNLGKISTGMAALDLLRRSALAFQRALDVNDKEKSPIKWAENQTNLGMAWGDIGQQTTGEVSRKAFDDSIAALKKSLDILTQNGTPSLWAITQINLGVVYGALGEVTSGDRGLEYFIRAAEALEKALEVYTKIHMPLDWAMTQNNLGIVHGLIGERSSGDAMLTSFDKAIAALKNASEVYTNDAMPAKYAMVQRNLGNIYLLKGERTGGEELILCLQNAVVTFAIALEAKDYPGSEIHLTGTHLTKVRAQTILQKKLLGEN